MERSWLHEISHYSITPLLHYSFGKNMKSRIIPTWRLAAFFAAGAIWFFAVPWVGQAFVWLGLAYNAALLGLVISDWLNLTDSANITVRRECQTALSIGEQNPIWIEAVHRGRRPFEITVKDEPPIEFETNPRILNFKIDPDATVRMNYKVFPSERGDYRFGNVNVRYYTALGLLCRQESIPSEMPVKVYPDIFQTKKHLLLWRQNRQYQMGIRQYRLLGQGREFRRLRDYVPDDSPRDIDWKATARRGVLTTREYDVEQSQTMMILLDMGRTMASRTMDQDGKLGITKLDCAINASVLLAHVAGQSDDRVGLYCFAREPITYVPPGKGAPQAAHLLETLYALKPRVEEPAYFENFTLVSRRQSKRSLIFLFTDLIDPEASRRLISSIGLLARKHLVVCIALADYELPSIIESDPQDPADLYTQAVAMNIVRERRKALAQLSAQGIVTIDATPSDLTVSTVNKYLQLKRTGRL